MSEQCLLFRYFEKERKDTPFDLTAPQTGCAGAYSNYLLIGNSAHSDSACC